jgi:hypothetical protein
MIERRPRASSRPATGCSCQRETRVYEYLVVLDDGHVLRATTDSSREGDYAEHREVLDTMMETLRFDR